MGNLSVQTVLAVRDLVVRFDAARVVDGIGFDLMRGQTLALVGESGSGKSVTSLSMMRLISRPGRIAGGSILFRGMDGSERDLLQLSEREMRGVRGKSIAMIFQEPMTSLNPVLRVGEQVAEAIMLHERKSRREALDITARLFGQVGIADPLRRLRAYPHQLSGGLRQRVMIAMALSSNPAVLIADEPTTALDVTVQAQILDLMQTLQHERGMSILFVTHDLGVVAQMASRVAVMWQGRIVEEGDVNEIFEAPHHAYTQRLLASSRALHQRT